MALRYITILGLIFISSYAEAVPIVSYFPDPELFQSQTPPLADRGFLTSIGGSTQFTARFPDGRVERATVSTSADTLFNYPRNWTTTVFGASAGDRLFGSKFNDGTFAASHGSATFLNLTVPERWLTTVTVDTDGGGRMSIVEHARNTVATQSADTIEYTKAYNFSIPTGAYTLTQRWDSRAVRSGADGAQVEQVGHAQGTAAGTWKVVQKFTGFTPVNELLAGARSNFDLKFPPPPTPRIPSAFCDFKCLAEKEIEVLARHERLLLLAELTAHPASGIVDLIVEQLITDPDVAARVSLQKTLLAPFEGTPAQRLIGTIAAVQGEFVRRQKAAQERIVASDPFDLNFREVAQPTFGTLTPVPFPPSAGAALVAASQNLVAKEDALLAFGRVLPVTMDRYSSALSVGDLNAAALQVRALGQYLQSYIDARFAVAMAMKQLQDALANQEVANRSVGPADIVALQESVRSRGVPLEVLLTLQSLGLSESVLANARDALLGLGPSDFPSGTFSGALGALSSVLAEEFEAPSAVPEPATLLLFGTTAAGLGLARWRQRRKRADVVTGD